RAAASRVLPLGLGRQSTARPVGVRRRVGICDLHHWVVEAILDTAVRAERAAPVGARHPVPPLPPIAQIHRAAGGPEHQRAWHQILRRGSRIQRRIWGLLGDGDVTGVGDELGELGVGYRMAFDGEGRDGRAVYRRLFWIELR